MSKSTHILVHNRDVIVDARMRILVTLKPKPPRNVDSSNIVSTKSDRARLNDAKKPNKTSGRRIGQKEDELNSKKDRVSVNIISKPNSLTIGIWDMGAWTGMLTDVLEKVNNGQDVFKFYEVKAAEPVGLISHPDQIVQWFKKKLGKNFKSANTKELKNNLIANEFFPIGAKVMRDIGLDLLVGITPSMVAGEDDGEIYWNHFTTDGMGTALVSSYQLREYSKEAKRPFESSLMILIFTQMLACHIPAIKYHPDTGCLFDYDSSRTGIIDKIRAPYIESSCMKLIPKKYRAAVTIILSTISKP